jgi:gliding motility-associated-like protein
VEVEVLERPAAPLIISNSPICLADEDAQVELQIAPTSQQAGALYRWFGPDGFTPLATASTDSVLVLNNLLPYSTGGSFPFYARTSVNGCVSALSQPTVVQFDVVPPNAAVAGMDTTICASQYTLRAIAPSVGSGRWSLAGATDPATVIIANPDQPGSIVTGLSIAGGPYVLRWTLSNGACRDYSADEVTINVAPAEQADAGEDIIACADEIINLNATPPALAGSAGQWTQDFGQTAFGVVIEQPGNPSTLISGLVPNNIFTFTWEVSSSCGLSVDRVRVIIVDPMPVAGADQSICADEPTAALQAAQPGLGSSGAWSSPDSTLVFTSASSPATSVRNLKPGVNVLVWTVDGGVCGADSRDTLLITYNKPPIAIADTITVPFGRTVELMPLDNDTIYGVVTLLAGTTPDRGTVSYQGSTIRYTPPANFLGETSFSYQLVAPGCPTATGQVFVQIGEDAGCKPPSIITPNDDGINDFFVVPCLLDTERYPNSQVIIFNRWGDEVFRSGKPYMSNWGAKYDGTDLPADTYFFVVELGDGSSPLSGYVLIQR